MRWLNILFRATLAVACLIGASRLLAAEAHYARGMKATDLQTSLDHLSLAGVTYPYTSQFRTAQAKQLFALAKRIPALTPAAVTALDYAMQDDPGSLEIASALYLAQCAVGDLAGAVRSAYRMREIAPRSAAVKRIIAGGCSE